MLGKIGQIAIRIQNLDRATATYRDALGLKFLFAYPPLAFFDAGGTWLMLSPAEQPEFDHPSSILYFDVDDIAAEHARMKAARIAFRTEPHKVHTEGTRELWLADFRDGEGNTFCLRQWKQAA